MTNAQLLDFIETLGEYRIWKDFETGEWHSAAHTLGLGSGRTVRGAIADSPRALRGHGYTALSFRRDRERFMRGPDPSPVSQHVEPQDVK